MARTYGQSTSLGTTNAQRPSPMPTHRERLIKALRAPKKKSRVYTAKPSIYPIGEPPPRESEIVPVVAPPLGVQPIIDEPTVEEAYIPEPNLDVAMRGLPAIIPPEYDYSARPNTEPGGVQYIAEPEMQEVEIGGRIVRVPRTRIPGPPPDLRMPGTPPMIDEARVQASRNRGGQSAGIMGAIATLLGGNANYIGENIPAITAQGIAGGETGALDRYGREYQNFQLGEAANEQANQTATRQYQMQGQYADTLNAANDAPMEAAVRQIGVENAVKRVEQADRRLKLTERGLDLRDQARGFAAFQKYDKIFRESPPDMRREMISDEYLSHYGISPTAAGIYRSLVDKDLTDPLERQKIGKALIADQFAALKNNLLDPASKEALFKALPALAAEYGLDLSMLPTEVNFEAMSPSDSLRFQIAMLEHFSKDTYRKGSLAIMGQRIGIDKMRLAFEKLNMARIAYENETDPKWKYNAYSNLASALSYMQPTMTNPETGETTPNPMYQAVAGAMSQLNSGFGMGYKPDFYAWLNSQFGGTLNNAGGGAGIPPIKTFPANPPFNPAPISPPGQTPFSPTNPLESYLRPPGFSDISGYGDSGVPPISAPKRGGKQRAAPAKAKGSAPKPTPSPRPTPKSTPSAPKPVQDAARRVNRGR